MRKKLENYCDDDYLIAMGDPVAIAIAAMVASDINQGKVNILKCFLMLKKGLAVWV